MPPHHDDYGSDASGGGRGRRWDADRFAREREEVFMTGGLGPPARVRDRERDTERFERRIYEEDRYGPPARRPERRFEEEDDFYYKSRGSGPLIEVSRRREEDSLRPPPLLRRQSSLDTFDRMPARKHHHAPPPPVVGIPPSQRRRRSPPRSPRAVERDVYEEIRIAEPEFYGDEEFREFRERDRGPHRMRSRSRGSRGSETVVKEKLVEERIVEKPYPRRGKTRMPKRLVNTRAIIDLEYPYVEEDDVIVIQKALSKELIDEIVSLSQEYKQRSETARIKKYWTPSPSLSSSSSSRSPIREEIVEKVIVNRSPRRHEDALVIQRSPSQHRSRSRVRAVEVVDRLELPTVGHRRARSMTSHVGVSPVRIIERKDAGIRESSAIRTGPMAMVVRPKRSEEDIIIERRPQGTVDIINHTEVVTSSGNQEEVTEITDVKKDRPAPDSRLLRAMMASLT